MNSLLWYWLYEVIDLVFTFIKLFIQFLGFEAYQSSSSSVIRMCHNVCFCLHAVWSFWRIGTIWLDSVVLKFTVNKIYDVKCSKCFVIKFIFELVLLWNVLFVFKMGQSNKYFVIMYLYLLHIFLFFKGIMAILLCGITMSHYAHFNLSPMGQLAVQHVFRLLALVAGFF